MIRIDMEMPKTCYECPFAMRSYATLYVIQGNYSCILTHETITSMKRNRFCPLRELVRCKDCVHCPTKGEQDIRFPDDVCPCQCEDDYYYSWIPQPNWFCPKGEKVTE